LKKVYYVILLFTCLGLKPIYTIGYVSYYELNIDYIIQKYCINKSKPKYKCNGKCHLAKRLSLTSPSEIETDQKIISNSLSEAFFPVFFNEYAIIGNLKIEDMKRPFVFSKNKEYQVFLSITSPPPRC